MVPALFGAEPLFPGAVVGKNRQPPSLDDLEKRLRAAQEHRASRRRGTDEPAGTSAESSGIGLAFRIGVEMVSALVVGVAIGLLVDWWLGTRPWFLVVFFVLGAGAALLNAYRAAMGFGLAVGYRKPEGETPEDASGTGAENGDAGASGRSEGKQG